MSRYQINFELADLGGRFDELAGKTALPLGTARALYELGILWKRGHELPGVSEDRIHQGVALYDFVHANKGYGTVMATGIDQKAEGTNYAARAVEFPDFQKDPETGIYLLKPTESIGGREGNTSIPPAGFTLFRPAERNLYNGFGFAHATTNDKAEAIESQTAYFKRLGLDEQIAADVAKAETSYSWRRDGVDGVFAVHRYFWNERLGPWDVNTGGRPDDRDGSVGAVLSKEAASGASAEATDEFKQLVETANRAYVRLVDTAKPEQV
ncbi:MAG: hypothetical protein KKA90_02775 [Nanoarchaeota archaeon]|nr:hypothetical protein [Nanoarchaeota archaeon]